MTTDLPPQVNTDHSINGLCQSRRPVTASDPETGRTRARTVVATIISDGPKDLVEIGVGDTGVIVATANHPFWDEAGKEWVNAGKVRPGTVLRAEDGSTVTVRPVRAYAQPQRVRNLTVATDHTYYLAGADEDVLVRNRGGRGPLACGVKANADKRRMPENRAAQGHAPVIQPQASVPALHQLPSFAKKAPGTPPLVKLHNYATKEMGKDPAKFADSLEGKVEKAEKDIGFFEKLGELLG
ncbi:polymorphic toxin-type HINT domain-containing protein [Nonomuraea sp. NPDC050394]|uniref:polymorphic toxin-type HINT domain-containing protein n=1 Tax=Nonomuraea sp. NPDC050394 TaxID=3364363 RepID=UPI0037A02906